MEFASTLRNLEFDRKIMWGVGNDERALVFGQQILRAGYGNGPEKIEPN